MASLLADIVGRTSSSRRSAEAQQADASFKFQLAAFASGSIARILAKLVPSIFPAGVESLSGKAWLGLTKSSSQDGMDSMLPRSCSVSTCTTDSGATDMTGLQAEAADIAMKTQQLQELTERLQESEAVAAELGRDKASLQAENDRLRADSERLQRELAAAVEKYKKSEDSAWESLRLLSEHAQQHEENVCAGLRAHLAAASHQAQQLMGMVDSLQRERAQLEMWCQQLQQECQQQSDALEQHEAARQEAQWNSQELRESCKALQEQLHTSEAEAHVLQHKLAAAVQQQQEAAAETSMLRQRLRASEYKAQSLQLQQEVAAADLHLLEQQLRESEADGVTLLQELEGATACASQLVQQLWACKDEADTREQQLEAAVAHVRMLEQHLQCAVADVQLLQGRLACTEAELREEQVAGLRLRGHMMQHQLEKAAQ